MSHALLSASGSKKWLSCTPSVRLEEQLPETTSSYAEEGSLAHEIGELKLRKQFTDPMGPRAFNTKLKKLKENSLYQEEMNGHTDTYLNYVSEVVHSYNSPPYIAIEKKIDYSQYAPEGFGTGDCIVIGGNTLHIIDLKYGKGIPVSAEDNSQMMLYALGAYYEYAFLYPIETVKMVIVQPRLNNISEYYMSVEGLLAWGESIKPIAQKAFAGEGEFVPGEHCRFCRAKATCRARTEVHTALEDFKMMKPPLISNEEIGSILQKAKNLVQWVSDLEDYALSELLKGNAVEGWKAVAGRANRKFINVDLAFEILKIKGIDEAMLYERKPITLTAVETLLGKPQFKELLDGYIETPPGKPTIALESDKREAIKRASAQEDFSGEPEMEDLCGQ